MTYFGKFLVCLNLVFASIFLTWSVALYSQRLDWKGRLETLEDQINTYSVKRDADQARWAAELPQLPLVEKERADYKLWYPEQIQILRTGKDKAGKPVEGVVRQLIRLPDGLRLDLNNKEKVVSILVAIDPAEKLEVLRSYEDYDAELKKLNEELATNQIKIKELTVQLDNLTEKIADTVKRDAKGEPVLNDKGQPEIVKKGLRSQLSDEQSYAKLFTDEMATLRPELGSRLVEVDITRRRVEQLTARLKQLQDVGIAARP